MTKTARYGDDAGARSSIPLHLLAIAWVLGMLAFAWLDPLDYEAAMQEDRAVEWWTVTLFLGAGIFALGKAVRERRVFDGLVALFCLFVAGEEFSWGQRLLGFIPPDTFLEHNKQQEFTLHNFTAIATEPKWVLIIAMSGFGLLLPVLARMPITAGMLQKIRATSARPAAALWFAVAIVLLIWYPVKFTGEWVEALAGGLFLVTFAPRPASALSFAGAGVAAAFALTLFSGMQRGRSSEFVACAQSETKAIVNDLIQGEAATNRLARASSVHKRIWTAAGDGYIDLSRLAEYTSNRCDTNENAARRKAHAVDPWGTAYWLETDERDYGRLVRVYSFGPNRRRDGDRGDAAEFGDDVSYSVVVPWPQNALAATGNVNTPEVATGRSRNGSTRGEIK